MTKFETKSAAKRLITGTIFALVSSTFCLSAQATIVQFDTNIGNFRVNLYDQGTPITVTNFLNYVNAGSYTNTIFHRSATNFVIQGGGFTYDADEEFVIQNIITNAAIKNEPVYSNVRATIAMAKTSAPNSATSQWFFNLGDSNVSLDTSNGGLFTVFGEVIDDGMAIIDQIAATPIYNLGSPLNELPLQNYDTSAPPIESNFIIVSQITIIDSAVNTAANLNPPKNPNTSTPAPTPTTGSGGGTFNFVLLFLLSIIMLRKAPKI